MSCSFVEVTDSPTKPVLVAGDLRTERQVAGMTVSISAMSTDTVITDSAVVASVADEVRATKI